jgi:hypothetical protein
MKNIIIRVTSQTKDWSSIAGGFGAVKLNKHRLGITYEGDKRGQILAKTG